MWLQEAQTYGSYCVLLQASIEPLPIYLLELVLSVQLYSHSLPDLERVSIFGPHFFCHTLYETALYSLVALNSVYGLVFPKFISSAQFFFLPTLR